MTHVRPMALTMCFVILLAASNLSAANRARYFKEDGLTGADYLVLATDGTYSLTGREHMGVCVMGHTFHLKKFLARKGTALPLFPRCPLVGNMRPSSEVSGQAWRQASM